MKEQLVQLLLQLAGILWPRGKSKSFTICFYFWSCLSIGWLTSATCSSFVYKMFFTCTNLPPSFLSLYFSLSFLPPSLASFFPLLISGWLEWWLSIYFCYTWHLWKKSEQNSSSPSARYLSLLLFQHVLVYSVNRQILGICNGFNAEEI